MLDINPGLALLFAVLAGICLSIKVLFWWSIFRRARAYRNELNTKLAKLLSDSNTIVHSVPFSPTIFVSQSLLICAIGHNLIEGAYDGQAVGLEWFQTRRPNQLLSYVHFYNESAPNDLNELDMTKENLADLKLPNDVYKQVFDLLSDINIHVKQITINSKAVTLNLQGFDAAWMCNTLSDWYEPANKVAQVFEWALSDGLKTYRILLNRS